MVGALASSKENHEDLWSRYFSLMTGQVPGQSAAAQEVANAEPRRASPPP